MNLQEQLKPLNQFIFIPHKPLKNIKGEILLTFVAELFEDYLRIKKDSKLASEANFINNILIDSTIKELLEYFNLHIIRKEQLSRLFNQTSYNNKEILLAKQYEVFGIYYKKLLNLLLQYIQKDTKFMPEYFGILLIYYFKVETKREFSDFEFIQNYDISPLLAVYENINISLKKEFLITHPNKRLWEYRTTIDNMDKLALKLIKKYDQFQYKISRSKN